MATASLNDELYTWSSPALDVHMFSRRYEAHAGIYEKQDELWIFLCTDGGGRLVRRSTAQNLDGLFLPGIVGVGSHHGGGEGLWPDLKLIGIGIEPPRLAVLLDEFPPGHLDIEAVASAFHQNPLLAAIIREMWAHVGLHGHSSAFLDHGLAMAIHLLARSNGPARQAPAKHPLAPSELKTIVDFVDANIAEDLSVERLARLVGVSNFHFIRRFRATTGLAPYQFLTQRRLDRVAELLVSTPLPVTEVGLMTGYANPSHLAAAFRRHKGIPPLAWRRARRGS